jgi:hypothetical protein
MYVTLISHLSYFHQAQTPKMYHVLLSDTAVTDEVEEARMQRAKSRGLQGNLMESAAITRVPL